jgi:hypothetical protein
MPTTTALARAVVKHAHDRRDVARAILDQRDHAARERGGSGANV